MELPKGGIIIISRLEYDATIKAVVEVEINKLKKTDEYINAHETMRSFIHEYLNLLSLNELKAKNYTLQRDGSDISIVSSFLNKNFKF